MRFAFGSAAVVVAGLLIANGSEARAQIPPDRSFAGPAVLPMPYAAAILPGSPRYPYVTVPWAAAAGYPMPAADEVYRTSPYGSDSRYAYWSTGPFPGLIRPYVQFENPHALKHAAGRCRTCR